MDLILALLLFFGSPSDGTVKPVIDKNSVNKDKTLEEVKFTITTWDIDDEEKPLFRP